MEVARRPDIPEEVEWLVREMAWRLLQLGLERPVYIDIYPDGEEYVAEIS